MRMSLVALPLALVALPACTSTMSSDPTHVAVELRHCFEAVAPLDVADKAKVLAPCAEEKGPALIAQLESVEPRAPQADCHADALAGARRAVGAMQDLLKVYRRAKGNDAGPRAIASARNIDQGLTQLQDALRICMP
ncbi:MAG TPA: hypothetical protein VGL86_26100 [Polyangia bacterium]|jgi:hypothetical protein